MTDLTALTVNELAETVATGGSGGWGLDDARGSRAAALAELQTRANQHDELQADALRFGGNVWKARAEALAWWL